MTTATETDRMSDRTSSYLMDDPREAERLTAKVDERAWATRYLAPHLFDGAEVLCAGCGPGHLLRGAAEIEPGISGTGVDLSPRRIAEARARCRSQHNLGFLAGDLQNLPLPDKF